MSKTSDAKIEYDLLKEKKELSLFLPNSTGDWDQDKTRFTKLFEENQKIIQDAMNLDTLLDENDLEDFDDYPDW